MARILPPFTSSIGGFPITNVGFSIVNSPNFFVKAVWQQPTTNFATWASRGVNTLVSVPSGSDPATWTAAAVSAALNMIREPASPISGDIRQAKLASWFLPDEPSNVTGGSLTYGQVAYDPSVIEQLALGYKSVNSSRAVMCNMVGNHVQNFFSGVDHAIGTVAPIIPDYLRQPAIDWWSSDCYQVAQSQPFLCTSDGYTSTVQGYCIDRMAFWSNGRPQMQWIATVPVFSGNPQITADQFRAQAWSSIIHGAFGIGYFSIVLTPSFSFDGTPGGILTEMATLHSNISSIESILVDTMNGGRRQILLRQSANNGNSPTGVQLPYPIEGCEIGTTTGTYKIALNLTNAPATLTDSRWSASGLSFAAYEAKFGYTLS